MTRASDLSAVGSVLLRYFSVYSARSNPPDHPANIPLSGRWLRSTADQPSPPASAAREPASSRRVPTTLGSMTLRIDAHARLSLLTHKPREPIGRSKAQGYATISRPLIFRARPRKRGVLPWTRGAACRQDASSREGHSHWALLKTPTPKPASPTTFALDAETDSRSIRTGRGIHDAARGIVQVCWLRAIPLRSQDLLPVLFHDRAAVARGRRQSGP